MKNIRSILIAGAIAGASFSAIAVTDIDSRSFNVTQSADGVTHTKTVGVNASDVKITDAVAMSILKASTDKNWRVYSSTKGGIVTLEGFVPNEADRVLVEKATSETHGVRGINNKVVVGPVPDVFTPVKLITAAEEDAELAKSRKATK